MRKIADSPATIYTVGHTQRHCRGIIGDIFLGVSDAECCHHDALGGARRAFTTYNLETTVAHPLNGA